MIHFNTTNNSALKCYWLLKQKGVINCTFFLELLDESLEFVDPFDENLDEETKNKIVVECKLNPWYFIRECVLIPSSGKVRFEFNLGNLAFIWSFLHNFNVYMVLPRQCGKTFAAATCCLWVLYFGGYNTEMRLFAQADENLNNNTGRIRAMRQNLPSYLQFHNKKYDRDGKMLMAFSALGNKILRSAPKRSAEAADAAGRGFSTPIAWYDEFPFIPNIEPMYQSSVLAQSTAANIAEENGLPHSIMITTTAAFLNTSGGKFAYKFFLDSFEFTESLYDEDIETVKSMMKNEAKRNFLRINYDYWELGKDDDYFLRQCTDLGGDRDAIDREVLSKWKEVGVDHPLGQETVTLLSNYMVKPVKILVINEIYRLKLYKDPDEIDWGIPYIIGGDCANNVGEDYSALVIVDPRNYEVIGTIRTNSYSTMLYAKMIVALMTNFFYKSILVLERNLNGATIMDKIVEEKYDLIKRIYAPVKKPDKLGIETNVKSRPILFNQVLKMAVDDSYELIHDITIIEEIKQLIRLRNGRIDHPLGGHDDTLISYLFARWFLLFGEMPERYLDPMIIGIWKDIEARNDEDLEEQRTKKYSSLLEKQKRSKEIMKAILRKGDSLNNMKQEIPSVMEQHNAIKSGKMSNDMSFMSMSKTISVDDIMGNSYDLYKRYNPEVEKKKIEEKEKVELYTLDPNEIKEFEDKAEEEKYEKDIYNKNPKDIEYKKEKLDTEPQFKRTLEVGENMDDITADLKWFMGSGFR